MSDLNQTTGDVSNGSQTTNSNHHIRSSSNLSVSGIMNLVPGTGSSSSNNRVDLSVNSISVGGGGNTTDQSISQVTSSGGGGCGGTNVFAHSSTLPKIITQQQQPTIATSGNGSGLPLLTVTGTSGSHNNLSGGPRSSSMLTTAEIEALTETHLNNTGRHQQTTTTGVTLPVIGASSFLSDMRHSLQLSNTSSPSNGGSANGSLSNELFDSAHSLQASMANFSANRMFLDSNAVKMRNKSVNAPGANSSQVVTNKMFPLLSQDLGISMSTILPSASSTSLMIGSSGNYQTQSSPSGSNQLQNLHHTFSSSNVLTSNSPNGSTVIRNIPSSASSISSTSLLLQQHLASSGNASSILLPDYEEYATKSGNNANNAVAAMTAAQLAQYRNQNINKLTTYSLLPAASSNNRSDYESLYRKYAELDGFHNDLITRLSLAQAENQTQRKKIEEVVKVNKNLEQQWQVAMRQLDKAKNEIKELHDHLELVKRQRDEANKECHNAMETRSIAIKEKQRMYEERNTAVNEYILIMSERDSVHKEIERLQEDLNKLQRKHKALEKEHKVTMEELESLRREISSAMSDRDRAIKLCNDLKQKYGEPLITSSGSLDTSQYFSETTTSHSNTQQGQANCSSSSNSSLLGPHSSTTTTTNTEVGSGSAFGSVNHHANHHHPWSLKSSKSTLQHHLSSHASSSSSVLSSNFGIAGGGGQKSATELCHTESTVTTQNGAYSLSLPSNNNNNNSISTTTNVPLDQIESLRINQLQLELQEAYQEIEVCKKRRNWAFSERDKIVLERESIRTLCDKLRRERDRKVSDLAEALRESDEIKRQKHEALKELKELKDKLASGKGSKESATSKTNNEVNTSASTGPNKNCTSQDSAIDMDIESNMPTINIVNSHIPVTGPLADPGSELLDIQLKRKSTKAEWGFKIKMDEHSLEQPTVVVSSVQCHTQLRENDQLIKVNDLLMSTMAHAAPAVMLGKVQSLIYNAGTELTVQVRRCKLIQNLQTVTIPLNNTDQQQQQVEQQQQQQAKSDISLMQHMGFDVECVLVVNRVDPNFAQKDLQIGDRIHALNGTTVSNILMPKMVQFVFGIANRNNTTSPRTLNAAVIRWLPNPFFGQQQQSLAQQSSLSIKSSLPTSENTNINLQQQLQQTPPLPPQTQCNLMTTQQPQSQSIQQKQQQQQQEIQLIQQIQQLRQHPEPSQFNEPKLSSKEQQQQQRQQQQQSESKYIVTSVNATTTTTITTNVTTTKVVNQTTTTTPPTPSTTMTTTIPKTANDLKLQSKTITVERTTMPTMPPVIGHRNLRSFLYKDVEQSLARSNLLTSNPPIQTTTQLHPRNNLFIPMPSISINTNELIVRPSVKSDATPVIAPAATVTTPANINSCKTNQYQQSCNSQNLSLMSPSNVQVSELITNKNRANCLVGAKKSIESSSDEEEEEDADSPTFVADDDNDADADDDTNTSDTATEDLKDDDSEPDETAEVKTIAKLDKVLEKYQTADSDIYGSTVTNSSGSSLLVVPGSLAIAAAALLPVSSSNNNTNAIETEPFLSKPFPTIIGTGNVATGQATASQQQQQTSDTINNCAGGGGKVVRRSSRNQMKKIRGQRCTLAASQFTEAAHELTLALTPSAHSTRASSGDTWPRYKPHQLLTSALPTFYKHHAHELQQIYSKQCQKITNNVANSSSSSSSRQTRSIVGGGGITKDDVNYHHFATIHARRKQRKSLCLFFPELFPSSGLSSTTGYGELDKSPQKRVAGDQAPPTSCSSITIDTTATSASSASATPSMRRSPRFDFECNLPPNLNVSYMSSQPSSKPKSSFFDHRNHHENINGDQSVQQPPPPPLPQQPPLQTPPVSSVITNASHWSRQSTNGNNTNGHHSHLSSYIDGSLGVSVVGLQQAQPQQQQSRESPSHYSANHGLIGMPSSVTSSIIHHHHGSPASPTSPYSNTSTGHMSLESEHKMSPLTRPDLYNSVKPNTNSNTSSFYGTSVQYDPVSPDTTGLANTSGNHYYAQSNIQHKQQQQQSPPSPPPPPPQPPPPPSQQQEQQGNIYSTYASYRIGPAGPLKAGPFVKDQIGKSTISQQTQMPQSSSQALQQQSLQVSQQGKGNSQHPNDMYMFCSLPGSSATTGNTSVDYSVVSAQNKDLFKYYKRRQNSGSIQQSVTTDSGLVTYLPSTKAVVKSTQARAHLIQQQHHHHHHHQSPPPYGEQPPVISSTVTEHLYHPNTYTNDPYGQILLKGSRNANDVSNIYGTVRNIAAVTQPPLQPPPPPPPPMSSPPPSYYSSCHSTAVTALTTSSLLGANHHLVNSQSHNQQQQQPAPPYPGETELSNVNASTVAAAAAAAAAANSAGAAAASVTANRLSMNLLNLPDLSNLNSLTSSTGSSATNNSMMPPRSLMMAGGSNLSSQGWQNELTASAAAVAGCGGAGSSKTLPNSKRMNNLLTIPDNSRYVKDNQTLQPPLYSSLYDPHLSSGNSLTSSLASTTGLPSYMQENIYGSLTTKGGNNLNRSTPPPSAPPSYNSSTDEVQLLANFEDNFNHALNITSTSARTRFRIPSNSSSTSVTKTCGKVAFPGLLSTAGGLPLSTTAIYGSTNGPLGICHLPSGDRSSLVSASGGPLLEVKWLKCTKDGSPGSQILDPSKAKPDDYRLISIERSSALIGIRILKTTKSKGVFVQMVTEGSLAAAADIKVGDQIIDICGINMRAADFENAAKVLNQCGDPIQMLVQNQYEKFKEIWQMMSESERRSSLDNGQDTATVNSVTTTAPSPSSYLVAPQLVGSEARKANNTTLSGGENAAIKEQTSSESRYGIIVESNKSIMPVSNNNSVGEEETGGPPRCRRRSTRREVDLTQNCSMLGSSQHSRHSTLTNDDMSSTSSASTLTRRPKVESLPRECALASNSSPLEISNEQKPSQPQPPPSQSSQPPQPQTQTTISPGIVATVLAPAVVSSQNNILPFTTASFVTTSDSVSSQVPLVGGSSDITSNTSSSELATDVIQNGQSEQLDVNIDNPEYRQIVIQKSCSSLGLSLIGGNAVGIFIHSVRDEQLLASGLQAGDRIIEFNGADLRHATAEEAATELAKPAEVVHMVVHQDLQRFHEIQQTNVGDSFYIRCAFDRPSVDGSLAFHKNQVLYVDNTMYKGVPGLWSAWTVNAAGEKEKSGIVPSRYKAEEELMMKRGGPYSNDSIATGGGTLGFSSRRSFFRRKKSGSGGSGTFSSGGAISNAIAHFRSSSRDSTTKEIACYSDVASLRASGSDSGLDGAGNESTGPDSSPDYIIPVTYIHVEKLRYDLPRPVIIIGPLKEIFIEKLEQDFPKFFQRCPPIPTFPHDHDDHEAINTANKILDRLVAEKKIVDYRRRGSCFECTTIDSVRKISCNNLHALLDVNPHSVERLNNCHLYPVIVFLKFKSTKQIKEINRCPSEKLSSKAAKEMYEHSMKIETELKELITVTIPGSNLSYMCTQVKMCVEQEQMKALWI